MRVRPDVELRNGHYQIAFKFNADVVALVRTIPGRYYDPKTKLWLVPHTPEAEARIQELGWEKPKAYVDKTERQVFPRIACPGLKRQLMPFQEEALGFLQQSAPGSLLAFEPGLGKTISTIAHAHYAGLLPILVVCPASLKWNWQAEIDKTVDWQTQILEGRVTSALAGDAVIINYDILENWWCRLCRYGFKLVAFDESHYLANAKTARTKTSTDIGKRIPNNIALSGTPIVNRPYDLWPTLDMLRPGEFGTSWKFAYRYCDLHKSDYGMDFSGASNMEELYSRLTSTCMFRLKKQDVLADLPPKTYAMQYLPITAPAGELAELYHQAGYGISDPNPLARLEAKKQRSLWGKLPAALEWVEAFLASGQKLLLFGWHTRALDYLEQQFGSVSVRVDGSTDGKTRQARVDKFQSDASVRLFLGNIKAAGVGLNLTAASSVAFLEFAWTPAAMEQAADRAHRHGQKENVTVYYLCGRGSVDEQIAELLIKKSGVSSAIIDGDPEGAGSIFHELIHLA